MFDFQLTGKQQQFCNNWSKTVVQKGSGAGVFLIFDFLK